MSLITIITMLIIAGTVWGGFAFALSIAIKSEKGKDN
jgi:hypothetical protein